MIHGLALGFIFLMLSAMGSCGAPTYPTVDIHDNTGPVSANITNGSNSPVGTAPCAVAGAPQKGTAQGAGAPDCSTVTPAPVVVVGP